MGRFLAVEAVSKIFNPGQEIELVGLKEVDLDISRGEFVVISGPSGSGKTTLLNIIGGLDCATSGKVFLRDFELTAMDERGLAALRRDSIGFVFQSYNLIPVLTARENTQYVMQLQGWDGERIAARVGEVVVKLGIENMLDKLPGQLSGGQQQRVAVARAVAAKPDLILADEPTANLDSKSAEELMDMMQQLNQDEEITIIFSSHDPMVIGKAKHSVLLRDGKIIADRFGLD